MKSTLPFFVASALLAGCVSKPDYRDNSEVFFETKINKDGTKLFAFSVGMNRDKGRGGDRGKGQRPQGNGQRPQGNGQRSEQGQASNNDTPRSDKRMENFYQLLAEKLEDTQYCRDGYIEVDTHETEDRYHLLGECQESASEADKRTFLNAY